jgi:hypothetical protein
MVDNDPHPLHRDHSTMELGPVQVADTLGGLLCGTHGDKTIAASPGAPGVSHHFSANNLMLRQRRIEHLICGQGRCVGSKSTVQFHTYILHEHIYQKK